MMYLIMGTKVAKPAVLMVIWWIAQIAPQAETLFGKLLEYGVSFGLLAFIAFLFYREWKSSETYNKDRDDRLEVLIENNTTAMRNTKDAIDDMRDELMVLHNRSIENRNMINRWQDNKN